MTWFWSSYGGKYNHVEMQKSSPAKGLNCLIPIIYYSIPPASSHFLMPLCQLMTCFKSNIMGFLQTPQSPIVRTKAYGKYCIDEYPTGTNAIVAVLAYSG